MVANLCLRKVNKNSTQKKGSQTNPKDAQNAEKRASKKTKSLFMMQFVQNVEFKLKFLLNPRQGKKFIAETALKKIHSKI